jgi:hypothetical protein
MEPTQNPNVGPAGPSNPNQQPGKPDGASVERPSTPVNPEQAPVVGQAAAGQSSAQAALPVIPADSDQAAAGASAPQSGSAESAAPGAASNPAVAADVDIIEKEWVDRAEKIVDQTKDNPYQEEEAIESLQEDYLQKRYGHTVKPHGTSGSQIDKSAPPAGPSTPGSGQ